MTNQNNSAKKNNQYNDCLSPGDELKNVKLFSDHLKNDITDIVHGSFDPFNSYRLQYHISFFYGANTDVDIRKSKHYFGSFTLQKEVNGSSCTYDVKRHITGYLNNNNSAKPASITHYYHTATNDIYPVLGSKDEIHYDYKVAREYYNDYISEAYNSSLDIIIDDNKNIMKSINGSKYILGTYSKHLFTPYTLVDALQKITAAKQSRELDLSFDLLESMEILKPNQRVRYYDTIITDFGGNDIILTGYCHTGEGTLPSYYWITQQGLLVMARLGISNWFLSAHDYI